MEEKEMQPMQPEGSSLTGRRIKDGVRTPVAGRRSSASEGPGISGRTGNSGRSRISGNRRLVRRKPQSRRRRQRNLIIKMSVVLILLIVAVVGTFLWKKYSPSKEKADLNKYYGIEKKGQVAITVNNKVVDPHGMISDGKLYVQYDVIRDYVNSRFYWDPNENILLYTLPKDMVSVEVGSKDYIVSN